MANWLNPIVTVLDRAEKPVQFFFRDDDAGWENDKLFTLLDVFARELTPIDLAVIPNSVTPMLSDELLSRWRTDDHLLGLHQHGYSHTNHELESRKCEFGSARTKQQQRADLSEGQAVLKHYLGDALDPFFTPPWNRCTQDTVDCLEIMDFKLLSQDITAKPLSSSTLKHVPVHIDWSRAIKIPTDPLAELSQRIVSNLSENALIGFMLHHADMDLEALNPLAELLRVFSQHPNIQGIRLMDTLR